MWIESLQYLTVSAAVGVVIGLILLPLIQRKHERDAWGVRRAALTPSARREIRRAARAGRAVTDPALATPAIEYGEAVLRFAHGMRRRPPVATAVCVVLSGAGGWMIVEAFEGHDWFLGIVAGLMILLGAAGLPFPARWLQPGQARRERALAASIEANREMLPA